MKLCLLHFPPVTLTTVKPMPTNTSIQSYADAQAFLFSRFNLERTMVEPSPDTFKLERMRQLAGLLGNPQSQIPTIHIAGTKGKGSVSSMLSQILTEAGYTTGLFTSPHLEHLGQRFCINGVASSEQEIVDILKQIVPAVEEMDRRDIENPDIDLKPTFFEITTAFAFLYFLKHHVDIAVIEVGLGGRLDSTNICEPILTAITNIGLDHTEILGDTLELIAGEKAGIIKANIPVVNGCDLPGPREVIERVAANHTAPLLNVANEITYEEATSSSMYPQLSSVRIHDQLQWSDLTIGLPGIHQINNAAVCLGLVHELIKQDYALSPIAVRAGLSKVKCHGRLELFKGQPNILLDVAHNPNSTHALVEFLNSHFANKKLHLILSCSRDKQYDEIGEILAPHFHSLTLTKYQNNPRSVEPQTLFDAIVSSCNNLATRTQIIVSPLEALQQVRQQAAPDDLIVVTGSFYLIAELRPLVLVDLKKNSS